MGFEPNQADIDAIKERTDNLPDDPADESSLEALHAATAALLAQVTSYMDFWSLTGAKVTVSQAAADLDFPLADPNNIVVVSGLPSGVSISLVVPLLKIAGLNDTSGAANYIDVTGGAGNYDAIRVMKDGGSWGTDDIVALDIGHSLWYVDADVIRSSGDVVIGKRDLSSVVDGDGTYHFRSEETNRGDAIHALADDLELVDVQIGLRVYFNPSS